MAIYRKVGVMLGAVALGLSAACSQDLNVTNPNNPDVARAIASPKDVQTLAQSSVHDWYLTSTYVEPYLMLGVTADAMTANFGNFGMRFNNLQPRIEYHNQSADGDAEVTRIPWNSNYATLGEANDVLRAIKGGLVITDAPTTQAFKALARFSQAGTFTNLALAYDKAFIVDENTDLATASSLQMLPYAKVRDAAMASWDSVIANTAGQSYQYPAGTLPLDKLLLNSTVLNRVANTMAALTLAYAPRDAGEVGAMTAADWQKVYNYADKGIGTGSAGAAFDFSVVGDNNLWYSYILYYGDEQSWVRADMKLINKMDASVPAEYAGAATNVPPSGTGDARLGACSQLGSKCTVALAAASGKDFLYRGDVIGDPGRGIYMQSPYFHARWVAYARTSGSTRALGPAPYILAAESDLVKAEALVRIGGAANFVTAAGLINNTRVNRGKLPALTGAETAAQLISAITYEREVEGFATNGFTHYALRHVDDLRQYTLRHVPVPAAELEILGLPLYTFGGPNYPVKSLFPESASMSIASLGASSSSESRSLTLPNGQVMQLHLGGAHLPLAAMEAFHQ